MSNIKNTFINALLADAAYAERLSDLMTVEQLQDALSLRMTTTLATFISNNFEVVSHKETEDDPGQRNRVRPCLLPDLHFRAIIALWLVL